MPTKQEGQTRFCKDCKHAKLDLPTRFFLPFTGYKFAKCTHHTALSKFDRDDYLVTGKPIAWQYSYCSTMRGSWSEGYCGKEGKYWKKKS